MLKWLVTKGPSESTTSGNKLMTEDPLATISRRIKRNDPVYSVSRINPLFEEEGNQNGIIPTNDQICKPTAFFKESPSSESPATDRESVRSSGYESKETDSASLRSDSQEEEEGNIPDSKSLPDDVAIHSGNVAELTRSFENLSNNPGHHKFYRTNEVPHPHRNRDFVKSGEIGNHKPSQTLEAIPEVRESNENSPSKTVVPNNAVGNLTKGQNNENFEMDIMKKMRKLKHGSINKNTNKNQMIRFNPLVSVVVKDKKYVTSISVSPNEESGMTNNMSNKDPLKHSDKPRLKSKLINNSSHSLTNYGYLRDNGLSYMLYLNNDHNLEQDSLINEETLDLMKTTPKPEEQQHLSEFPYPHCSIYNIPPSDIPDFGRAVYTELCLKRKANVPPSQRTVSGREAVKRNNCSLTNSAKKLKGVSVVKGLWEKTGLKVNGRKLLVDFNDLLNDDRRPISSSRNSACYHEASSFPGDARLPTSKVYEVIPACFPSASAVTCNELYGTEKGIANPGFLGDNGYSRDASKPGSHFQYNMTDFQKRVREKLQHEPTNFCRDEASLTASDGNEDIKEKRKTYSGNTVREFGLSGETCGRNDNCGFTWISNGNSEYQDYSSRGSQGRSKLFHFWKSFYHNSLEGSCSGEFSPHPNGEAVLCGRGEGPCQDFTMDSGRSFQTERKSSNATKRKRCCSCLVILAAFSLFIGIIIGISWFYTGGQRIFGPM